MLHPFAKTLIVATLTLVIWVAAAGSVVAWGLKVTAKETSAQVAPVASDTGVEIDSSQIARLLGSRKSDGAATPVPTDGRYSLVGLAAAQGRGEGSVALIAIEGKPPRPYRLGATVEPGVMVQSIAPKKVALAAAAHDATPLAVLELPTRP